MSKLLKTFLLLLFIEIGMFLEPKKKQKKNKEHQLAN